ncbi:MAG: 2-dehydropantoate 2-reductase [Deltaproteobacteria bacterium HGW-Deltaproteobacteria-14]|nr:MAG: 2-dehydropantoate 2-reductase [Deltaproteobacteria bacterium HGW-Deltaproteobacteria-14]
MTDAELRIAVVGAGAIGGVTAVFLAEAGHAVQIVTKHPAVAAQARGDGLRVRGVRGEHRATLDGVATVAELRGPLDVALLATKSTEVVEVARELLPLMAEGGVVLTMQNGITEQAVAEVVGEHAVVACVVAWGATMLEPGTLEMTSEGEFVLGALDGRPVEALAPLATLLSAVVPTRVATNMMGERYSKLIINACVTTLGGVCGLLLGDMLARRPARELFIAIMREAMAVADAMGVRVEPGGGGKLDFYRFVRGDGWLDRFKRHAMIRLIGFKYRRLKSSTLQSLERGKPTEIDFLNGYIVAMGARHGVPTPVNAALVRMVKEIEAGTRAIAYANLQEVAIAGR